jgi:hypothetical protein
MTNMQLTFLGATGTVTGSKYLITAGAKASAVPANRQSEKKAAA